MFEGERDEETLDADGCLRRIVEYERLIAHAQASQLRLVARFAELRPGSAPGSVSEFAADEIAAELQLTRNAANRRVDLALALTSRLPRTLEELHRGTIDLPKARAVAEETRLVDAPVAAAVEARAHELASARDVSTISWWRATLRRLLLRADPEGGERRHELARSERAVVVIPQPDGMADLWARLTAAEAIAVYSRLDAHATRTRRPEDGSSNDNRRADSLVALVLAGGPTTRSGPDAPGATEERGTAKVGRADDAVVGPSACVTGDDSSLAEAHGVGAADGEDEAGGTDRTAGPATRSVGPRRSRIRADVHVTVAASTLAGLDDEPGELAGHGAIPASVARELAAGDATWRRILTDPATGALLDYGRSTYRPPAALADHVRTRDRTCRAPGCGRGARHCDLDHSTPYPEGTTSAGNLGATCRHHHRAKHEGGWRLTQPRPGVFDWVSPTGRGYRVAPEPLDHSGS